MKPCPGGHRVKTFCLLEVDGKTTKGIAICSDDDQIDPTEGRAYAYDRAFAAMVGGSDLYSKDGRLLLGVSHETLERTMSDYDRKLLGKIC